MEGLLALALGFWEKADGVGESLISTGLANVEVGEKATMAARTRRLLDWSCIWPMRAG
jgi:hypothetical protein